MSAEDLPEPMTDEEIERQKLYAQACYEADLVNIFFTGVSVGIAITVMTFLCVGVLS